MSIGVGELRLSIYLGWFVVKGYAFEYQKGWQRSLAWLWKRLMLSK
jgi:hypothetical protein